MSNTKDENGRGWYDFSYGKFFSLLFIIASTCKTLISCGNIYRDYRNLGWNIHDKSFQQRLIGALILLCLNLFELILYRRYYEYRKETNTNTDEDTDIPKDTRLAMYAIESEKTSIVVFSPEERLHLDKDLFVIMDGQYILLFRELISYMNKVISSNSSELYFPYYGDSDKLYWGSSDANNSKNTSIQRFNKKLLSFEPKAYLLDFIETNKGSKGVKLDRLIYKNYSNNFEVERKNLESLQHQVDGMIDVLERIGPGEGAGNRRDYVTILLTICGIPQEILRYLNNKRYDLEKDLEIDNEFKDQLIDGVTYRKGMGRIENINKQYDRDKRINKLLSIHQEILSKNDIREYEKRIKGLPSVGISECGYLSIPSLRRSIEGIDDYRNTIFSRFFVPYSFRNDRLSSILQDQDFPMIENMSLYMIQVLEGYRQLNIVHSGYLVADNSKNKGYLIGKDYDNLIVNTINDRTKLDIYYADMKDIRNKFSANMDTDGKIALRQFGLMVSRFDRNMHLLMRYRHYDLIFRICTVKKIRHINVGKKFRLSTQEVLFLKELIDQCNKIMTEKTEKTGKISDFLYHYDKYDLIRKGRHSNESYQDIQGKEGIIDKVTGHLIKSVNQKKLLRMEIESSPSLDNPGSNGNGYCNLDMGDTSDNSKAIGNILLLRYQFEWISTVMGSIFSVSESRESRVLNELSDVIRDILPGKILSIIVDHSNALKDSKFEERLRITQSEEESRYDEYDDDEKNEYNDDEKNEYDTLDSYGINDTQSNQILSEDTLIKASILSGIDQVESEEGYLISYPLDDKMNMDQDYTLRFGMNGPNGILDLNLSLNLPAQQLVLLRRLIDHIQILVIERPSNLTSGTSYHGSDNRLKTGNHPEERNSGIVKKGEKIAPLNNKIVSNDQQRKLLHLYSECGEDNRTIFYRLFFMNNNISVESVLHDLDLLEDQLKLIYDVMYYIYNESDKEPSEGAIYAALKNVFKTDLLKEITEYMQVYIRNDRTWIIEPSCREYDRIIDFDQSKDRNDGEIRIESIGWNQQPLISDRFGNVLKRVFKDNAARRMIIVTFDSNFFLMQRQYLFLLISLISHMRQYIDGSISERDPFPFRGHLDRLYWDKNYNSEMRDRLYANDTILIREIISNTFRYGRFTYSLDTRNYRGIDGVELSEVIYNDTNDLRDAINNTLFLKYQINGMIGTLEIIGSGTGLRNERDYGTLLRLLNLIPIKVGESIESKWGASGASVELGMDTENIVHTQSSNLILSTMNGSSKESGSITINAIIEQYKRDIRMDNLLSRDQKILSPESEYLELKNLYKDIQETLSDNDSVIERNSIESGRNLVLGFGDYREALIRTDNRISNACHLQYMPSLSLESYDSTVSRLRMELQGMNTRYLKYSNSSVNEYIEDLDEDDESISSTDYYHGNLMDLAMGDLEDLDRYRENLKGIKNKVVDDMDINESVAFRRYDLMVSQFNQDLNIMKAHEAEFLAQYPDYAGDNDDHSDQII